MGVPQDIEALQARCDVLEARADALEAVHAQIAEDHAALKQWVLNVTRVIRTTRTGEKM